MNRRKIAAATALVLGTPALLANSCAGPGWEGDGTIVELELMEYESDGHRLTETEALEVTVVYGNQREAAVEVEAECMHHLAVGQTLTRDILVAQCGDLSYSSDD